MTKKAAQNNTSISSNSSSTIRAGIRPTGVNTRVDVNTQARGIADGWLSAVANFFGSLHVYTSLLIRWRIRQRTTLGCPAGVVNQGLQEDNFGLDSWTCLLDCYLITTVRMQLPTKRAFHFELVLLTVAVSRLGLTGKRFPQFLQLAPRIFFCGSRTVFLGGSILRP